VIGGFLYSLNDIENGILRSNRQSMGTLYRKPFKSGDPRLKISLAHVDPRIHFALNCGAKSCPPIKTFSGDQVQDQLQVATSSFLEVSIYLFIYYLDLSISMLRVRNVNFIFINFLLLFQNSHIK